MSKTATMKDRIAEPPELTRQVEARKQAEARRAEEAAKPKPEEPVEQTLFVDTRNCEGCSQPFESSAVILQGREICRKTHCDACIELREALEAQQREEEQREARKAAVAARWSKICPPRYAEPFDIEKAIAGIREEREDAWKKIAKQNREEVRRWTQADEQEVRETIAKIQAFQYSDRGLGIVGPSGHAKTRVMFTLIHRFLMEGKDCAYINLAVFGREVGARFGESAKAANDWINRFCRIPVLFFDDVGKEKMTERVETETYGIIETRSANMLPIYFTANSRGDRLIEKMTDDDGNISDRAAPIVRRLRQYSEGFTL